VHFQDSRPGTEAPDQLVKGHVFRSTLLQDLEREPRRRQRHSVVNSASVFFKTDGQEYFILRPAIRVSGLPRPQGLPGAFASLRENEGANCWLRCCLARSLVRVWWLLLRRRTGLEIKCPEKPHRVTRVCSWDRVGPCKLIGTAVLFRPC